MILDILPYTVVSDENCTWNWCQHRGSINRPVEIEEDNDSLTQEECRWFWCDQYKVKGIQPVQLEEDNLFWTTAYDWIYVISCSSALIFFLIVSWITTWIKYLILNHKDKSVTYKSVLKSSVWTYILAFVFSLVVMWMVHSAIASMNEGIGAIML